MPISFGYGNKSTETLSNVTHFLWSQGQLRASFPSLTLLSMAVPPLPLRGVLVFLPALFVPGVVRVRVRGSSDTFADIVHGERKQEVCLHLAGCESGLLWREGKARSGCVMGSGPQVLSGATWTSECPTSCGHHRPWSHLRTRR